MAGHRDVWRSDQDGTLTSEAHGFRLLVLPARGGDGVVRFGVMRNGGGDRSVLLCSGRADDERTAMKAALRVAERIAAGAEPAPEARGL
jgi:hypothetical protein